MPPPPPLPLWPIFALAQKVSRQVTRLRRFNRFQATSSSHKKKELVRKVTTGQVEEKMPLESSTLLV